MVEKIEGATMTCLNCNTDLICRLKEYGGNYKSSLQWQNEDGTAHYSTKDGKNFTCNIPTDDEAQEVHKLIRELLAKIGDQEVAAKIRIQYGGSVKPENSAELLSQPDIDGALVGGASLKSESFVQIVKSGCSIKT